MAGSPVQYLVQRRYDHRTMKEVSQAFAEPRGWVTRQGVPVPLELRNVAATFAYLQDERHEADYNLQTRFTKPRALEAIERTEVAMARWSQVRLTDAARLYLLTMLLGGPRK